jgi:hypothetical protein
LFCLCNHKEVDETIETDYSPSSLVYLENKEMMCRYSEKKKNNLKSLGKNDIIGTQVYHGNSHQILKMKGTAPYSFLESVVFSRYKWETYSKVVGVNLYSSPHIPTLSTSFMEASYLESNLSKYSFHFITKTNDSSNIVNPKNPPTTRDGARKYFEQGSRHF